MSNNNVCQVPLWELLRGIPKDFRQWFDEPNGVSRHIPIGVYCHEVADILEKQWKEKLADQSQGGDNTNLIKQNEALREALLWARPYVARIRDTEAIDKALNLSANNEIKPNEVGSARIKDEESINERLRNPQSTAFMKQWNKK